MVNYMKENVIRGRGMFYIVLVTLIMGFSLFIAMKNKLKLEHEEYGKIKEKSNYIYSIQKEEEQNKILSKNIIKLENIQNHKFP